MNILLKETNEDILINKLSDLYDSSPEVCDSIYDEAISVLDAYDYDDVDMLDEHVWEYFRDIITESVSDNNFTHIGATKDERLLKLIALDDESFKKEVLLTFEQR